MAIYHLKLNLIRRRDARSAVAGAAYRAGERIEDHRTGLTHDYRRKGGVVDTGIDGWSGDRSGLWNAAERSERHPRAIVARELVLALPHELTAADRREIVRGFAAYIHDRHGVAIDWAIHGPTANSPRNHHAHLMLTTRVAGKDGMSLGAKTRELDVAAIGAAHLAHWRRTWAEHVNERLWLAGFDGAIDHRSHKAADRQREALRHLGPTLTALEANGVATAVGDKNRERRRRNRERRLIEVRLRGIRHSIAELIQSAAEIAVETPTNARESVRVL